MPPAHAHPQPAQLPLPPEPAQGTRPRQGGLLVTRWSGRLGLSERGRLQANRLMSSWHLRSLKGPLETHDQVFKASHSTPYLRQRFSEIRGHEVHFGPHLDMSRPGPFLDPRCWGAPSQGAQFH